MVGRCMYTAQGSLVCQNKVKEGFEEEDPQLVEGFEVEEVPMSMEQYEEEEVPMENFGLVDDVRNYGKNVTNYISRGRGPAPSHLY